MLNSERMHEAEVCATTHVGRPCSGHMCFGGDRTRKSTLPDERRIALARDIRQTDSYQISTKTVILSLQIGGQKGVNYRVGLDLSKFILRNVILFD